MVTLSASLLDYPMKTTAYLTVCLRSLWLILFLCLGAATAQRIAYVTPAGELATVEPDGSQMRVLADAGRYQFPAWSPDGERVAVIGADAEGAAIFSVVDRALSESVRHYSSQREAPIYLYWSPDSETISFLANRPEVGLALHLAPVSGEDNPEESRLLSVGSPFYWQWSADARRLLVHTGLTGEDARLGFMAAAEDNLTENLSSPGLFQAPGISASGDYIAYAEIDASERGRVVLTDTPGDERDADTVREVPHQGLVALSWSPAEDTLALMSPQVAAPHTYGPIRLLDAQTGDLTTLIEETAIAFFWSPDGSKIAYLSPLAGDDGGGRVTELGTEVAGMKVSAAAQPRAPLLLNLSVVDVASGVSERLTTFAPSPLFVGQYLPFFDQYALSHRVWSPASDALALPMLVGDGVTPQIVVVPLRGEPQPVAPGDMPSWSP